MDEKSLGVLKLAAIGLVLVYLYNLAKAKGTTLSGPFGAKLNPDHVINLASHLVPEEYRPQAREVGYAVMGKIFN